ncbi:chemotaxis protein CheW [Phenylobacterium immobile]|uniref:chemotaxis protein CheW n=1 Tax=Phenylobacterium immobile TaxID=21 RepID=UPI000A9862FE|nr:chemotaxis protein CheW [Phenylobacterium immobile]
MIAPTGPFLIFRLEESLFALPAAAVAEILPLAILDRPVGSPAVLAGFLNLGGEPLAVADLGALVGQAGKDDPQDVYRHILHLAEGGLGLLVDRVTDLTTTADSASAAAPAESVNGLITARLTIGGRMVSLLDPQGLLLEEERLRLAELAEAARARIADAASAQA